MTALSSLTGVRCFPPVVGHSPQVLILGSAPGRASLDATEYYAHPRNLFWRFLGDMLGFSPRLPYDERLVRLTDAGVALWDVIAACERTGSLDADIMPGSIEPNDFEAFFTVHRSIRHVFFNGTAAEKEFRRRVLPELSGNCPHLHRLPSTSPAHAARSLAEKQHAWAAIVAALNM